MTERQATARGPRCPICGRAATEAFRPFCTRRCADVDLARWLNEAYVLPDWRERPDDDSDDSQGETGSDPKAPSRE